jgi:chaperone required for assembly of F1-ATPase
MKRFYKSVTVEETADGFRLLLNGRPVQTPARQPMRLPSRALAEAVAEEWRAQGEEIDPVSMPLTRLVNTVLDGVRATREDVIESILRLGDSDLLSYRAESPAELARRQEQWDQILDWAAERHGARLLVTSGIAPIEQPAEAMAALGRAVSSRDDYAVAALHVLASVTGSLVLGLAVLDEALTPVDAFALSRLDEGIQAESWGVDREAEERAERLAAEMEQAARLARLSRT